LDETGVPSEETEARGPQITAFFAKPKASQLFLRVLKKTVYHITKNLFYFFT